MTVNDLANELLSHAAAHAEYGVTIELSIMAGSSGVTAKVIHHTPAGPRNFLVILTEYYKSTIRNRHIIKPLPIELVIEEYDRLAIDAADLGFLEAS